jgi:hypothetical protein
MLILMGIAHANEKRKVGKSTSVEVVIRKRFMHTQTNNKNAMALAYHACHGMQQK